MQHLTAPQLAQLIASQPVQLLDVREPWEVDIASLSDITQIPMGEITTRHGELNQDLPVVCICHHGVRSLQVGLFLERQGFENVLNLTGGMDAWSKLVDSSCRIY